jgi:hypothetical protein
VAVVDREAFAVRRKPPCKENTNANRQKHGQAALLYNAFLTPQSWRSAPEQITRHPWPNKGGDSKTRLASGYCANGETNVH